MDDPIKNSQPAFPPWSEVLGVKWRWLIAGVGALAVLAWAGTKGLGVYRTWRAETLSARSRAFFLKGDYRNAVISAREVLRLRPNHESALELMAVMAEQLNPATAILWWQKLAEAAPRRSDALFQWARAGLRSQDLVTAELALSKVTGSAKASARFQELHGVLALGLRQLDRAEQCFLEARRIEPANPVHQYNLANLRLQSTRPEIIRDGRAELQRLAAVEGPLRILALRTLLGEAHRTGDRQAALALSLQLVSLPGAGFAERLQRLTVLQEASAPELGSYLKQMEHEATNNPAQTASFIAWHLQQGQASNALAWAGTLPRALCAHQAVQLALAEGYAATKNWARLHDHVAGADWQEINFLRLAFQALVLREREDLIKSQAIWSQAVREVQHDQGKLAMLAQLVYSLGWRAPAEKIWWQLVERGQAAALESLFQLYFQNHQGRELYRVAEQLYRRNPQEPVARNNYASLALLLNRQLEEAAPLARENHQRFPQNPALATTYAFALYRQGKAAEGLELLKSFSEAIRREPSLAAYLGVLLAANSRIDEAKPLATKALQSGRLLNEETEMMEDILAGRKLSP